MEYCIILEGQKGGKKCFTVARYTQFMREKTTHFHGMPYRSIKKEVSPSALNEIPEMLKIPVFPGFPFIDRKKRGHKRGKFIKV